MNKRLTIKIEEAKSWFVLAQIIIILAGFMFTTSGVFYSNAQMVSNKIRYLEIINRAT